MGNPRVSPEEHNNLGVSIRRHVRRNRNLFASISNQRQGPAAAPRPDLRNETREGEPLLEEGKSIMSHVILSDIGNVLCIFVVYMLVLLDIF